MLEMSLALALTALAAVGTIRTMVLTDRLRTADVQADVMNMYRKGLQTYTDENYIPLQAGMQVVKAGITLPAGTALGQSYQPDIASLIAMGYLPTGFSNNVILVDDAGFRNQIVLEPAGCVNVACNVRGLAYIDQPIRIRGSADTDGTSIGQMLMRIGGDAGTSVEGATATISAVGSGWTWANPVAGAPAGIVAARFGFDASGLGQFVRINDPRDPALQGNLSALGNLNIGGTATLAGATTVGGALTVNGNTAVRNAGGMTCVSLDRSGIVTISCDGRLNAATGVFTDGLGNTTTIGPTGVVATGRVAAAQGLSTASGTVFDAADANAISVAGGPMFFRLTGGPGPLTLMALDGGDVVAGKNVSAQRLAIQSVAVVGAPCGNTSGTLTGTATEYASTANGGLAVCTGGVWVSLNNRASANTPCTPDGLMATDIATGKGLFCKHGYYILADSLLSNFVMGTPFAISGDGAVVTKSDYIICDPLGAGTGVPLAYILPQNETSVNSAFSRTAIDSNPGSNAGTWTFRMKDGVGNPLTSVTAIVQPFCYY